MANVEHMAVETSISATNDNVLMFKAARGINKGHIYWLAQSLQALQP